MKYKLGFVKAINAYIGIGINKNQILELMDIYGMSLLEKNRILAINLTMWFPNEIFKCLEGRKFFF